MCSLEDNNIERISLECGAAGQWAGCGGHLLFGKRSANLLSITCSFLISFESLFFFPMYYPDGQGQALPSKKTKGDLHTLCLTERWTKDVGLTDRTHGLRSLLSYLSV